MNPCKITMKLPAAILFATVTIVMATQPASKIISNMKTNLDTLGKMFQKISAKKCNIQNIRGTGGAVYVRWGHDRCPSQSGLVYAGYAGGSHYSHTGGAAEFLCLSKKPNQSSDRRSYGSNAQLWGAEYELGSGHSKNDHDVPCAVCQSLHRANSLMIPGRDICPLGWRREYKGLLMSGQPTHKSATQHVCVDIARKVVPGSANNQNGKLLYVVRAVCGYSLKCPPYVKNQLITCAVCTN